MSSAQVEKFIAVICSDLTAWQQASKGATDVDSFVENAARYAHDKGYDFTADEVRTWMTQYQEQSPDGELQDSQLEAVAGGGPNEAAAMLLEYAKQVRRESRERR